MTNGYAVVEKNGQYGYIKQSGIIAIEPRYEEAYTLQKMDWRVLNVTENMDLSMHRAKK